MASRPSPLDQCHPQHLTIARVGVKGALVDTGDNALAVLRSIRDSSVLNWKSITSAVYALNPTIAQINLHRIQEGSNSIKHNVGGFTFDLDIARESEGFRRFLSHLAALYQLPSKKLLMFEEPERGIHPGALTTLAEEFQAYADTKRGQIILTTHNPQLLDHFDAESIRVVTMRDHSTTIDPISSEQLEAVKEGLLKPGELLTVDPARPQEVPAA
jgi:predicted ATPase